MMTPSEKKVFDGSHLLMDAGLKMQLRRETGSTAQIYFHRFFKHHANDVETFDVHVVAASCLWIAGRVNEEYNLKLRDIVNVYYALVNPDKADDPLECGVLYWSIKDSITSMELVILRVLQFNVVIDLPHKYLLHFLKSLTDWMDCSRENRVLFSRISWALLNDYFTSPLCLKHLDDPASVSIAVLQVSLLVNNLKIPYNDDSILTWEEALKQDISLQKLREIRLDVMSTYQPFIDGSCW